MLRTLKSLFLVGLLSLSQLALAMNPGNGKGSPSNKPSHQNFKADKSERSYSRPAPNQEKRQDAPSEKSNSANSAPSSKPTPTIADILRPERSYSRPAPTQERRQDAPSEKSNTTPASQASNKVANTSTPNSSPASASSSTSSSTPKNTASAEAHFRPIGQAIKEFQERNDERSSEVFKASLTKKREEASRQESTSDYDSSRSCSDDNLSHGSWNRAEESSASTQSESTQSQSNSSWFAWRTMASSSTPATQAAQKPVDEGNKANVSPNAATPLPVKSQKQFTTPLDYLNPKITLNHEQVKETEKQDPKTDAQLEADRKTVAAAVLLKARYIELITEQPQHHPLKTPATNPSDTPATLPAQNNEPKVNKPASKPKDKKAKKGGGFWSYLGFSPSDPPADLGVHSLDIFNEGKEMRTWGEEERRQQAIEQAEEHYRQEELKMAQTNNGYFETASEANQRAAAAKQQKEAELQAKHKQDEKDAKQAKKAKKAQNKKIWDDAGKATKLEQKEYEDRIKKEAKENPAKAKQAKKDAKQADEDRIRRNTDAFNRGAKNGGPLEFREPVKTKPQPNAPKVAPKKDQPVTPQPEKPKPAPAPQVIEPAIPAPVMPPIKVDPAPTPQPEKPKPAPVVTPPQPVIEPVIPKPVVPPVAPQPEKPKPAPEPEKPKVNPKPIVTSEPVAPQDRDLPDDREVIDERDKKTYEPENFSETIAGKVHDWLFPAPQTSPPLSFANLNPQNGFQYAGIPHKGIISPEIKKQFVTAPSPDKWAYPAPGDWKKGPAAQFFQSKSGKELACIAAGIGVGAGAYYFGVGAIASEACKTFILGTQLRLAVENGSLVTIRGVTMGAEAAQRVQPMVNSQSLLTAGQIQSFLAREGYTAFVAGEGMVAQNLNRLLGPGGNVIARVGNNVKLFENNASHIFTKEHLILDTPANRELLSKTASDAKNFLGVDKYGTEWYGKILPDGKQMWTQVRDGFIRNAGVNESVKVFDKDTGLSRNLSAINESTKNI